MAKLTVALEEGFDGDDVVVEVDDAVAFSADELRTRPEIGLAGSFDTEVAAAEAVVTLRCRGATTTVNVPMDEPAWVGFSIDPDTGEGTARVTATPFGHL